jgi:hypothetical protein
VDEKLFVDARVTGGNDKGLSFDSESHMANKTFVEDSVNEPAIVNAAFRKTLQGGSFGLREFHKEGIVVRKSPIVKRVVA